MWIRPAVVLAGALAVVAPPVLGASTPAGTLQRVDTSLKSVLAAVEAYLTAYQEDLTFLLADERYTQQVHDSTGRQTAARTMTGELFVTFLPADGAWISVHDFAQVDGQAVDDRDDIRSLLAREPIAGVARRLIGRNARFNIGGIIRNFSEPTLGLLVLEPRRRSQIKFDRTRVEREGDARIVTLAFKEVARPSLVRGMDGSDLFSTGELTAEAGTGRVRRTFVQFTYGPVVAQLTTVYVHEPKLDLWVPATMSERYQRARSPSELIVCEATYTNYRKFQVDVRFR